MPTRCYVCNIVCQKPMRCSKCHGTIYCSVTCQKANWKEHKRSACVKSPVFHKFDKMMKKFSGPNTPMGRLNKMEAAIWEARRLNPSPARKCDGCLRRFRGVPIDEDDFDEDGDKTDAGDVFKRCADCDYTICEDCSLPEYQGIAFFDRPSGTCRCKTSNFGVKYCLSGPCYLDGDGENPYHGDRHPPIADSGYDEDAYESNERKCKTCGIVARCLKQEHLKDVVPGDMLLLDHNPLRESMKLDPSLPWTETLVLSYPYTIDADVHDDLNREVAFYKQALHSAQEARHLASKHHLPFTRPPDFFAEMVKSDAHMERIRIRLLNESSSIKISEDKRKEREGKKFGKQVQIEKIKERERSKKEMAEKLKTLKRKRKDILDKPRGKDDEFDVAVEDAISDRPAKRGKASNGKSIPRTVRDKKYGFGGVGRRAKQNTKESTDNFDSSKAGRGRKPGGGGFKGRHNTKRLGKSRRITAKSKS